jgi:hypothetical protein
MAKPDSLTASCSVVVDLPVEQFDLAGWIPSMSNDDYLACTPASHAHKQMLVYRDTHGGYVFRNDETVAGFLMTQLYRPEIMEPRHVFLVSPQTKARYLRFVPLHIQVTWDMKVESFDADRSTFTCTVGARLNPVLRLAGFLIRLPYWTEAHTEEETPHFADSAVRWARHRNSVTQN